MVDLETFGVNDDAPVIQISAKTFILGQNDSAQLGQQAQSFDMSLDFSTVGGLDVQISTLMFWLKDAHNTETLKQMLNKNDNVASEVEMWRLFHSWLTHAVKSGQGDVRIWGNGISFDVVKVKKNFARFGLDYPIDFWNERDVRTITDLASQVLNMTPRAFQKSVPNDNKHDALADVEWQIKYVQKAFKLLT